MFKDSKVVFLFVLLLLLPAGGCSRFGRGARQALWREGAGWLVERDVIDAANLQRLWEVRLPVKADEKLDKLILHDEYLYALSSKNFMVCLNRNNGKVVFSTYIGPETFPVIGLGVFDEQIYSVIGGSLVEIDCQTGSRLDSTELGYEVTCPASRNSSFFYLGAAERRLHVLRADDKVQVFEAASRTDSTIVSIIADEDLVIFATEDGDCIAIAPDRPTLLWEFEADEAVRGPVAKDVDSVYFAGKDTYLYRLDVLTGIFLWKCQLGAIPDKGPVVADEAVYQYCPGGGFIAVDKQSGKILWRLDEGLGLINESDGKAYVLTDKNDMVVMDNRKKKRLYSVDLTDVSKYACNKTDTRLYLAADDGRIACLKPAE